MINLLSCVEVFEVSEYFSLFQRGRVKRVQSRHESDAGVIVTPDEGGLCGL